MHATGKTPGGVPAELPPQGLAPFRGLGFDFSRLDQAARPTAPGPAADRVQAAPRSAATPASGRD